MTIDDWLQAGYAILAQEGIKSLKIDRLCEEAGATKGSFYWHFTDIDDYRKALISNWEDFVVQDRRRFREISKHPPRERLLEMMALLGSPKYWTLERAMREWARSDPALAATVQAADKLVEQAVRKAFVDFGLDPAEATLRAKLTFAAGIGSLHLHSAPSRALIARHRERLVDFLLSGG